VVSSVPVRAVSARPVAALLAVLLTALPGAAQSVDPQMPALQNPETPNPATQDPGVRPAPAPGTAPRGELLTVPTLAGEVGPRFDLGAVVERLGGRLQARLGESWVLTLVERQILFGPEGGAVALGTEIVPLSEPPQVVDGRIYVPLDFLEVTYGRLAGYRFSWDPRSRSLAALRRTPRSLAVSTDVVHLQGVTTVVVQFPETPRYRVVERPGGVDVLLVGDRFAATGRRPVTDPLVEGIEISAERVGIDLVPGAVADSYTLEDPFRVVFDVVRGGAAAGVPRNAPPAVAPRSRPGIHTIVLDPGHGGGETGAIGPSGAQEKDLTLLLARALKSRLEAHLGVRVILTRDNDAEVPHETRTAIANQNKADLFISLHLNSAFGAAARGAETYFLSATASDERAARAAEAENPPAAGEADNPLDDLQLILWDLAQSHSLSQSQRLATLIQQELNGALDLRDRGVKQAPFLVLMGAAMPSVLVELGFLSNPEEERRLQDPAYRAELTDALVRAVGAYKAEVERTQVTAGSRGDDAPPAASDAAPGTGGAGR